VTFEEDKNKIKNSYSQNVGEDPGKDGKRK
jgi:hypothetical protein